MNLKELVKNWCRSHVGFLLGGALVGTIWFLSSLGTV
jgi:hypothetical protein